MASPALTPAEQSYALAYTPGLRPPLGIAPNFVNPYSRGYLIVAATAITLTATTLLVLIRTYTKRFINKTGLGGDDYLSILAWVGYVAYSSLGYQVIHNGGFVHQWNVPAIKVMRFLKIFNELEILYGPVMFITKLSILLQLLHIFAPVRSGAAYYLCHFMIWFNLLFYTAITFAAIFVCRPRAKFWNPLLPGKCLDIDSVNIVTSVINATSDLVLLLLPIICVWKLQMGLRRKLGVSAVFATASFACVSSIMRTVTSVQVKGVQDVTWGLLPQGLWTLGEISSGIICGCMPTLLQFFRHLVPKITTAFSSSRRSSERGKSNDINPSTEQSDHVRSVKTKYPKSPYGDTESYVELDERRHEFKAIDSSKACPYVWSDEVSASDEENASPSMEEVGTTGLVQH